MVSILSENPEVRSKQKIFLWMTGGLIAVVAIVFLIGLLIQFLWNGVLTEMFDFPIISFWQAMGLFLLAKLFFGFGMGSSQKKQKDQKEHKDTKQLADPPDDETFINYWREEGKASYEAFLHDRQGNPGSE